MKAYVQKACIRCGRMRTIAATAAHAMKYCKACAHEVDKERLRSNRHLYANNYDFSNNLVPHCSKDTNLGDRLLECIAELSPEAREYFNQRIDNLVFEVAALGEARNGKRPHFGRMCAAELIWREQDLKDPIYIRKVKYR